MPLNPEHIRQHLKDFKFTPLFVEELGWERPRTVRVSVPAGVQVQEVAHLGGIPALEIRTGASIPDSKTRRSIHDQIAKQFHENLLIFVDGKRTQMLWSWIKRDGSKSFVREHPFVVGQPGDLFLSKLAGLFIDLEEYDETGAFSILRAGERLKKALDVSNVTKKFYREFSEQHVNFLDHIHGINSESDRRWYASVLLNRLMFVYFLQKKGFLDGENRFYLRQKIDKYTNCYESFLKPLFFKGFALPDSDADKQAVQQIIGVIPYLNGGLFLPHTIEIENPRITVDDIGFKNILGLFESYSWNLNDVPGEQDDELNPDVLGYIFEKYINNQKSAGAYYTPPEITEYLCERTIHDLLVERVSVFRNGKPKTYESVGDMLLDLDGSLCRVMLGVLNSLRLCDPAVGSGAFLVAALKTLTDIYGALWGRAEVLHDEELKLQLIGDEKKHRAPFYAIRKRIITQNLYGVDIMAEATEIARLRLFLSLVSSAKHVNELEPLPNIDFNILAGNSLIGMLSCESKHFAFTNLEVNSSYDELLKQKNKHVDLYRTSDYAPPAQRMQFKTEADYFRHQLHALCDSVILEQFLDKNILFEQAQAQGKPKKRPLHRDDIAQLQPFHWGYEFSHVMKDGGFDAIITNPPWEIWKPNSKEFFQEYSDVITKKKMSLKEFETHQKVLLQDQDISAAWFSYLSGFPHVSEYLRASEDYSHQISRVNGRKVGTDINLYKLFTERCYHLTKNKGRCGIVVPSGIYTDLGAKRLREMLFEKTKVTGLFCFENRRGIFEDVDSRFKFVVLTWQKGGETKAFPVAFMRHDVLDLRDFPNADSLSMETDLVRRLNPDSVSIMELKSEQDVSIAEKMMRFPPLGQNIPTRWNLTLTSEFHMTNDSHIFSTTPKKGALPLFEGKMVHHFRADFAAPRYWIDEKQGRSALLRKDQDNRQKLPYESYRLGFRDIARNTDERTLIATIVPPNAFMGNTLPTAQPNLSLTELMFLVAVFDSFAFDWLIRQKVTAHCNFFAVYSMPMPRLNQEDAAFPPIVRRAANLLCVTPDFDLLAKAAGLKGHEDGLSVPSARAALRAEIDALVAKLYGLTEPEFVHILSTFPLVSEPTKLAAHNKFRDLERGVWRP